jgi:hypothetical protein
VNIELRYSDDEIGIECTVFGKATLKDFKKACNETFNNTNIHTHKYQIVDFTKCDSFELTSDDMEELALIAINASIINPNIIIAFISPKDIEFGMSRVYEANANESGFKIKVFRNHEDAIDWVNRNL